MATMPDAPDPLETALARVGDRWTLLLINALLDGPRRFNELQEGLSGIATNVLSQRLKHLERAGVVVAQPYSTRPLRHVYELTAAGRELAGALRLLTSWGADHGDGAGGTPRHEACGSSLEPRWWCPTCDRVVDEHDHEGLHHV